MRESAYRPEIDGLRAIAVAVVVLFHGDVPGFGGGYVGVDVFFVISGYLITGILQRSLQAGTFSIAQFYERRIRRIYPALFVVLAASALAALAVLLPPELPGFGRSLLATSLYVANYHFMSDVGYFAAPAISKPLLHMWSLAVEEQFYVVFPLLLALVWRLAHRRLLPFVVLALLASLGYALWLAGRSPDQAFYSAPARAWELLVGSVVAVASAGAQRRAPSPGAGIAWSLAGLLGILVPVFGYSETTPFPGAWALPPVLGAACLIHGTGSAANPVAALLASRPMRGLGLISYSLYLWHWPVFVFCRVWRMTPPGPADIALQLAAAVVLAVLSYRFVETPFRRGGGRSHRPRVLATGMALMLVGALCGGLLARSDGLPGRLSPAALTALNAAADEPHVSDCEHPGEIVDGRPVLCPIGTSASSGGPGVFLVWGDSHAEALLPAIDDAARAAGVAGRYFVRGGCPPLLGVNQTREGFRDCSDRAEALVRHLQAETGIRTVVLAARWSLYANGTRFRGEAGHKVVIEDGMDRPAGIAGNATVMERALERTVSRLRALGLRVLLVTQVPETEFDLPRAVARARHLGRPVELAPTRTDYLARQASMEALLQRTLAAHEGLAVVRPDSVLCPAARCEVMAGERPLYRDSNHLTATAASRLAPLFGGLLAPQPRPQAP